jgi:hypothetical protein
VEWLSVANKIQLPPRAEATYKSSEENPLKALIRDVQCYLYLQPMEFVTLVICDAVAATQIKRQQSKNYPPTDRKQNQRTLS